MSFPKGAKSVRNKFTNQKLEVVSTEAVIRDFTVLSSHINFKTTTMLQFP